MVENAPAAITSPFGLVTRSSTAPLGEGANPVTAPAESTWARLARATPPTLVNEPPRYQPPDPSGTATLTEPTTSGKPGAKVSLTVSTMPTAPRVAGPTWVKLPPMTTVLPT